ncbi:MAG TPA: GlsB/YeaQ/YmgE family stress response membrane protein [Spongiibacteraceae bacterium]|nr:GlsB/YeaQ/YmgE family stress response membrane protein [Spongiibacteraceae bacterium]
MEQLLPLIIQLISGAVGGNVAGAALKNQSLGTLGNSLAGIVGGGIGGQLLSMLGMAGTAASGGGLDVGSIVSSLAGGGVGGAVLMVIIGFIKNALSKSN